MVLRGFPPPISPASPGNMIYGKEFPLASRAAGAPHAPRQDTLGGPPAAARELEAVNLLERKEGILNDPVYSGKGMAGLIG